ncbi:hypothetical protein CALVIDRAFT_193774 [Calocera viscosa TUFC12733]|uniref:Uncharacterized protein n=1 Tax=Calocera viscosa (strain TUFC12733) TaxID=1330018 RepID=A0A167KR67_CALVF|nr:hypothetical protein CALVIDRAFT_193774 [Calocera viscosa TUFC12733]
MAPQSNPKPKKGALLNAVTKGVSNQFHSLQKQTRTSARLLAKKTHAVVASSAVNDDVDMDDHAMAGARSNRAHAASAAIKKTLTAVATKLKSAGRRKEKMGDMMIIDPPQAPNLHGQPVSISPNSSRTLVNQINITHGYYSNHSSTIPSLTPSPGPSHEVEIDLSPLTTAPPTSDEEDEEMQDAQDEGFNSITAWRFDIPIINNPIIDNPIIDNPVIDNSIIKRESVTPKLSVDISGDTVMEDALTTPAPKFSPPVTPRAPTFSSPLTTPPSTAPPTPPPARKSLKIRVKNPTYVLPTAIRSRASLRVPSTISVESSRRDQKRGREENSEDDTEGLPKKRLKGSHESTTQPANLSDMSVTLDVMGEEPTPPLATDDDDCSVPQVTTSPDVTNAVTGPLSTPGKKSAKATKREIKALPKRQGTGSKKRGPCIVCGLDRGTKWKREDGTKKDICHG